MRVWFFILLNLIFFCPPAFSEDTLTVPKQYWEKAEVRKDSYYTFDQRASTVTFSTRHMFFKTLPGFFREFKGDFIFDPDNLSAARVDMILDARTVESHDTMRDKVLRSEDFFDAEHHPDVTFKSEKVVHAGELAYKIFGTLTLRGISQPVIFESRLKGIIIDGLGNKNLGFTAETVINRKDFGMAKGNMLGLFIGEKVRIALEVTGKPARKTSQAE